MSAKPAVANEFDDIRNRMREIARQEGRELPAEKPPEQPASAPATATETTDADNFDDEYGTFDYTGIIY